MAVPPVLKVLDPRLDVGLPRSYNADVGSTNVHYQQLAATTSTNNQTTFVGTTPSPGIVMGARWYIEYELRTTSAADPAIANHNWGPRQFPLSSVTDTLTLKLNNASFTTNLSRTIHKMMKFGTSKENLDRWMSQCPIKPDRIGQYNDAAVDLSKGPFQSYAANTLEETRSADAWAAGAYDIATGGVDFKKMLEPLFISPLDWSDTEQPGLLGVQNFQLILNYSDLRRCFSGVPASAITEVSFRNPPKLHLMYLTPPLTVPMPLAVTYPYYEMLPIPKDIEGQPAGGISWAAPAEFGYGAAGVESISDVLSFTSIPNRIYIYGDISPANPASAISTETADSFAVINSINITWGARPGVLGDATQHDLHRMAVRNGSSQSWLEFSRFQGSVLCLVPGVDFPLEAGETPGVAGNWQFQVRVSGLRLPSPEPTGVLGRARPSRIRLVVQPVLEGVSQWTMLGPGQPAQIVNLTGVLDKSSVLALELAPSGTGMSRQIRNYQGAGFLDVLKKIANVGSKVASAVLPVAGKIFPVAQPFVAPLQGVAQAVTDLTGGRKVRKCRGGATMSRAELASRASQ